MPKKLRFVLIGLGIVGAMLYLIYSGIEARGVPYKTVGSLAEQTRGDARTVKVTGKVVEGSLNYDPSKPLLKLSVRGPETDKTIRVVYEGVKPDALRPGGHVILTGRYTPNEAKLIAHTLMAKCPSRYKSKYESYSKSKTSTDKPPTPSNT